jgi:hypothetical protein
MNKKTTKFSVILVAGLILVNCDDSVFHYSEEYWDVYNEDGYIIPASWEVVGEPGIPDFYYDKGALWPGSTTYPNIIMPWKIHGTVKNGRLSINFPEPLELSGEYASEYTGGTKIARVLIVNEQYSSQHIALHSSRDIFNSSVVLIYYVDKEFSNGTITLKPGWNFWDHTTGMISQNIEDFLKHGYRWQIEMWY